MRKTVTLAEWITAGKPQPAFMKCSTEIYKEGFMPIKSVNPQTWWIKAINGRSYSGCPDSLVYTNEPIERD